LAQRPLVHECKHALYSIEAHDLLFTFALGNVNAYA
jgi:hypothetical protein